MKIKLLKCQICSNWYMPSAHSYHCPVCAAARFNIAGTLQHVNSQSGKPMVALFNVGNHAKTIMRVLSAMNF